MTLRRFRNVSSSLLFSLAGLACGCGVSTSTDGGSDDGGADLAVMDGPVVKPDLYMPMHPPLPQLDQHDGTVLQEVNMVTITYATSYCAMPPCPGYEYTGDAESFGDFVFASTWFPAVVGEYGVKGGKHVAKVIVPTMAPAKLSDGDIRTNLEAWINTNVVPAPTGNGFFYMIYFPSSTVITGGGSGGVSGGTSCVQYGGYHASSTHKGLNITYAVIPDCFGGVDDITVAASHELAEAASDPYRPPQGGYFLEPDEDDPWTIQAGQEIGDMCEFEASIYVSGTKVQRIWSNAAAMAGTDPCVPMGDPDYANVFPLVKDPFPTLAAGSVLKVQLYGWTSGEAQVWPISIGQAQEVGFTPDDQMAQLSAMTISPGQTVTLTLTVPEDASSGDLGGVIIQSAALDHIWPVGYQVQ